MPFADWGDGRRRAACRAALIAQEPLRRTYGAKKLSHQPSGGSLVPRSPVGACRPHGKGRPVGAHRLRSQAEEFAQTASAQRYAGYRSAYVPGSQGPAANAAYSRQSAASQYSRNNASYSTAARKRSGKGKKIAIGVIAR